MSIRVALQGGEVSSGGVQLDTCTTDGGGGVPGGGGIPAGGSGARGGGGIAALTASAAARIPSAGAKRIPAGGGGTPKPGGGCGIGVAGIGPASIGAASIGPAGIGATGIGACGIGACGIGACGIGPDCIGMPGGGMPIRGGPKPGCIGRIMGCIPIGPPIGPPIPAVHPWESSPGRNPGGLGCMPIIFIFSVAVVRQSSIFLRSCMPPPETHDGPKPGGIVMLHGRGPPIIPLTGRSIIGLAPWGSLLMAPPL